MSPIPKTMQACQVVEYNAPYQLRTVPVPHALGPTDLLVKVAAASLCHTDGVVRAGAFHTALPCTASHEGAGTVVAAGSAVMSLAPGARVMCGIPGRLCGRCADCTGPEARRHYCANVGGHTGVTRDGCFAEFVRMDAVATVRLPDAVSFETAAPLACAGCTIWRGVLLADLKPGQWIAFVGSGGGLGHLGIQFAKARGLMVVGVDARDEGLALSKKVGADVVVDARLGDEKVVEAVKKATGDVGADVTVNVSDAQTAAATACAVTKMHGLMIQIAQPEKVCVPFRELVFRDVRIHGSLVCSPEEAKWMLDVVTKHKISVSKTVFNGLAEIPKLIELAESGKLVGKGIIVVDPQQIEEERKTGIELV